MYNQQLLHWQWVQGDFVVGFTECLFGDFTHKWSLVYGSSGDCSQTENAPWSQENLPGALTITFSIFFQFLLDGCFKSLWHCRFRGRNKLLSLVSSYRALQCLFNNTNATILGNRKNIIEHSVVFFFKYVDDTLLVGSITKHFECISRREARLASICASTTCNPRLSTWLNNDWFGRHRQTSRAKKNTRKNVKRRHVEHIPVQRNTEPIRKI